MRINKFGISAVSALTAGFLGVMPAFAGTVTVQPGQSLWTIAQSHHVSLTSLESANRSVNPRNLAVGSTLQIPNQSAHRYVVKSGDTLWKIAHRLNVSVTSLERANPTVNPMNLLVGTRLVIPVGPYTHTAAARQTNSAPATQGNLYWMERVIHAEASGESLQTKIAVGNVIMHRLQSGQCGTTVKDVVFQVSNGHYQFTPVENRTIYNAPDADSVQAATAVLERGQDVVPGAMVFYNPAKTPAHSWVWSQQRMAQIGHMVFAK